RSSDLLGLRRGEPVEHQLVHAPLLGERRVVEVPLPLLDRLLIPVGAHFLGPVLRSFGAVVLELELFNQSLLRERRVGEVALGRLQRVLVFARNLGRGRLRVGRLRLGLLLGSGLWRRVRDRVGGLRVCRGRRGQRRRSEE